MSTLFCLHRVESTCFCVSDCRIPYRFLCTHVWLFWMNCLFKYSDNFINILENLRKHDSPQRTHHTRLPKESFRKKPCPVCVIVRVLLWGGQVLWPCSWRPRSWHGCVAACAPPPGAGPCTVTHIRWGHHFESHCSSWGWEQESQLPTWNEKAGFLPPGAAGPRAPAGLRGAHLCFLSCGHGVLSPGRGAWGCLHPGIRPSIWVRSSLFLPLQTLEGCFCHCVW